MPVVRFPEYASLVRAGQVFGVSNQAVKSTTAALATTWTGLAINNPTGSGVNLEMLGFHCQQVAAGVAGAVGLMIANSTGIAAELTPKNQLIGGGAGKALADTAATIGTPILYRVFGSLGSVATTAYALEQGINVDLKGSLIITPGNTVLTYTTAATTNALIFSFLWNEQPV